MADSGAATTATTESSLLSELESSSDLSSIHNLFSSYLQPFSPILKNPKKRSQSTKIDAETTTTIRLLAKKFLPFISRALTLIPKRLNETPKIDPRFASELFETYTLCISCLEAISSQLSCKPHHVQIQRVRLIHCYEYWGRYNDAQNEGLSVLEFIGNISGKRNGKIVGRVVPELGKENGDKDVALLVFEVGVSLVKCAANARSKKEEDYRRVLTMVDEIEPWLRVIDADSFEKLHKLLVTYLNRCTMFLVGEVAISDGNMARRFCNVTFKEYRRSSVNDQTLKFGRRICSSIFSQLDDQLLSNVDILTCILDNMAEECKIGKETAIVDFLELADYCAQKCRIATVNICGAVATHFFKLASDFSQVNLSVDKIMRLYAITLSMSDLSYNSRGCNSKMPKAVDDKSISKLLLDLEDELQSLSTAHGSVTILATDMGSYVSFCFTALKLLCELLSERINSERKNVLCGFEDISFSIKLPNIEDAFHQFRLNFLRASEKEIDVYEDNSRTILAIASAAFTLSFTTKQRAKESVSFLKHLISEDWGQANGLKYLYASLHNVGIILYRANRLKEATKSFKLCCQAAWKCILHFCEVSASNKDEPSSDLSEDSIAAFVTEACSKSTFLLDILYQCGSKKVSRTLIDCLRSWSVAQNLFDKIPSPVALVKQWVKIKCKETKDPEAGNTVPTINVLLSSSEMSKETLGILLEQELQAYKEMKSLNPELSKIMQKTITKILLEEIYTTKVSCLQKSRILIANARESRACGVEGLNDCLQNLSGAISSMSDLCSKDKEDSGLVCQLLAEAYCLRALCTQEVEPNSKLSSQDIGIALKLWLSQEHSQSAEQIHTASQNTITLLYHVVDLLSLKGYMEDHPDVYEMLIRFITLKSVPLKECLAMLWQSRSLNHALCTSPVNDSFIATLSKHCNLSMSMDFWKSCMERSKSLEVGFSQSLSVIPTLSIPDSYNSEHATQTLATIDEVKKAASDLMNTVPLSSKSLFLTAYLYHDLSEGLIARGLMIEALSYAKEAHRLRIKLLKKHFAYSIEQHDEIIDANGEVIQKRGYGLKTFHMHSSVATTAWSYDKGSSEFEDFILTSWNVLRCYLESVLQVGTIQETVGNGHEAEALLLWGKNISCFQRLPIFLVSFSAALGKLYRKQRLWHLAEKELESAKNVLAHSGTSISCSKCKLILEVTVDQQLGDLFRSHFSNTTGNKLQEELSKAEIIYRIAVDKLKLSEWKNCISNSKETSSRNTMFCDSVLIGGSDGSNLSSCANQAEQKAIQPKVTRKGRKTVKSLPQEQRVTSRVTRSSKQKNECAQSEVQNVVEGKQLYACNDALIGKGAQKSKVFSMGACGCKVACVCDDVNCWHCLPTGIMKSKSLRSILQMKWECTRRRFLLRLLIGIGKCLGGRSETHRAHEVFLEGISMMVSRSTFCTSLFPLSFTFLAKLIERNVTGDVFAVEQASMFYNICWFSLKISSNKATRNQCCDISFIPIPIVVSGLKLSFILCREVPELFQKVSRLLALLYTLSPLNEAFSMLASSSNTLSESQLASYFHQASLGTHLTYQLFSRLGRKKDESTMDVDDFCLSSSSFLNLQRLAPQSVLDLEEFILKFFQGLPCVTIVCISMLGDGYVSWLRELLPYNHSTHACLMFSRMNSDSAPVVIVLPVDPILSGSSKDGEDSSSSILFDKRSSDKLWCCPWGQSVIDEVVPLFKTILEENYLSSSGYTLEEDTKQNRSLWWNQRRKLDQWLSDLLRDVESLWFGPWKHLLLGELSDHKHLDSVQKKLMKNLKSKCKVDVHEDIIKAVIGGSVHASQQENCLSEVFLKKGCYIGGRGCRSPGEYSDSLSSLVFELILNAIQEIGDEEVVDREPVILVPDCDIQMLPWESLPILRNQEVYRMPSVASISCTYDRCCHFQEKIGKDSAVYPMIDPLDAYYLLNPGGDLCSTEAEFGNWFKGQNIEGTAGTSPSVNELSVALKNHDLFIYLGHGSGIQYIPGGEIQKLDRCAAILLMGCSSGSLSLNGPYTPKGAPLYYLFAGSPVIVANLWDVTDKDIDRFGKTMLDAWMKARSTASVDCEQCTEISDKFEDLNIDGGKRKAKKKTSRSATFEHSAVNTSASGCKHRPKIGSFMGQARGACTLPFLIGAAPVCYGVPTGIRKKKL